MKEPLDPKFKRIQEWVHLIVDNLERLFGERPGITLFVLILTSWGLMTGQAWAAAGSVLSPLLQLIQ